MNKYHIYFLVLSLSLLSAFLFEGSVFILATCLILFDRCLLGRVKIIHGVEFTAISIMLVALRYDFMVSVFFCVFIMFLLPAGINTFLGARFVTNKDFKIVRGFFGVFVNILSAALISYLGNLDPLLIMFFVLLFAHFLYTLKGKFTQNNYILDYFGIILNMIFNLSLVFFFHSFLLSIVVI
ncbi:MAG: hypothetical protein DRP06_02255 [Candidatus Aenigmatarchaeota archaeon]|nr:MAG: hypothetical protein DRP06_02255 [Candidatus Aenigmarchaeota archaeon]